MRGRERDVGDVVGVVAADEREEGDADVDDEDESDEYNSPIAAWDCLDDCVNGSPGEHVSLSVAAGGQHIRSILKRLHRRGHSAAVKREKEQGSIGDDGAHVALVEGGGILAARNLVELGVLPLAAGRVGLVGLRGGRRRC